MSFLRLGSIGLAVLLAACVGPGTPPPSDIEIRDRSVFQPGMRVGANLRGEADAPSHLPGGLGFEFGAMHASGEGRQTLAAGQPPVKFADRTFGSGQELRHEFDFSFFDFSYRVRHYFDGGPIGVEALGGVAYSKLDLTVSSATQGGRDSLPSAGLLVNVGVLWRVRRGTTLHSRMSMYDSLPTDGVEKASRLEAAVVQAIGRNLAVRGGYATWRLETDDDSSRSTVKMRYSGPSLGLELAF